MSKMKIVDLSQYRKGKENTGKDSDQANKDDRSIEEKLQNLIHKPFSETDSKKELIAIFEEEQLKKNKEDENE